MKKIFTLIAAATLALGASAQTATWNFSTWTAGSLTSDLTKDGLTVYAGEPYMDGETEKKQNVDIDGSKKTVDGVSYTLRLKTGGAATPNGKRALSFVAEGPVTVKVVATSSNKDDARTLLFGENAIGTTEEGDNIGTITIGTGDPIAYTYNYTGTGGTIYMSSASGGINFYSISVAPSTGGGGETPTPTPTPTDPSAAKVWDFTSMSADALAALADNSNWAADVQGTGEEAYTRYTYKTDIAADTYVDLASIGFSDGAGIEVGRTGGKLAGYAQKADGSWSGGIRVDANKRLQLNASNGVFKIKSLAAGDKVTINYQSGSDEARSFSVTNATPATLSAPKNSEEGSIKTETLTVTANGDVTLQQTKAINIFKIAVNADLPTAIASVEAAATIAAPAVKKYVENGQIVIVKGGKKFNVAGAQIQ